MSSEDLSGRHVIHFEHDLAIAGPQIFDIIRSLVFFNSPEKPLPVIHQRLINVDFTVFRIVRFSNQRQMTRVLSNQVLSFFVHFLPLLPSEEFDNQTIFYFPCVRKLMGYCNVAACHQFLLQ